MDTSKYIPTEGDFLTVKTIKELSADNRRAVIIDAGDWQEYNIAQTVVNKPTIAVQINKKTYQWTLNKTSNKSIGDELGYNTDKWVGAIIKFAVIDGGLHPYLNAVVIEKPQSGVASQ